MTTKETSEKNVSEVEQRTLRAFCDDCAGLTDGFPCFECYMQERGHRG